MSFPPPSSATKTVSAGTRIATIPTVRHMAWLYILTDGNGVPASTMGGASILDAVIGVTASGSASETIKPVARRRVGRRGKRPNVPIARAQHMIAMEVQVPQLPNSSDARPEASPSQDFKADLQVLIPFLRAFARSLCRNPDLAEDLAQDTLLKAWRSRSSYAPGTNLKAWLFTILRNEFYSNRRRAWRQVAWDQEKAEQRPDLEERQQWSSELSDTVRALYCLADEQREALILVAAGGFSYEEAAEICQCPVGTVKSRVCRARNSLMAILDNQEAPIDGEIPPERDGSSALMAQLHELTSRRPDVMRQLARQEGAPAA